MLLFWLLFYVVFENRWVLFAVGFVGVAFGFSILALGEQWIAVDSSNVMTLVSFSGGQFDYILGTFVSLVNFIVAYRAVRPAKVASTGK